MMKRLLMISVLTLAVVTMMAPVPAETAVITFGEPLTYTFDFTSQSPSPPYDGYSYRISFNALTPTGAVDVSYSPEFSGSKLVMFGWVAVGSQTVEGELASSHSLYPGVFDVTFNLNNFAQEASADITNVEIRMIDFVDSDPNNRAYTEWLAGTPVAPPIPEPSTMLLAGSGLAGLFGFGRRRLKK